MSFNSQSLNGTRNSLEFYNRIKAERQKLINTLESLEDGKYLTLSDADILFNERGSYKKFAIPERLLKKIDFSNVSFDNVDIRGMDFTELKGVKINPQTVYDQNLSRCKFSGVEFIGPFDGIYLYETDFTGSKGAKIKPQKFLRKELIGCTLSGVEFIGPFDGTYLRETDFTGSKGAKINPQTIYNKNLSECKFSGVEFIGSFDRVIIEGVDFTGSKGARINPQTVNARDLRGCAFSGVEFIGPFDGVHLYRTDFTGSKGAKINPQTVYLRDLRGCTFSEVEFIGPFDGVHLYETNFTGSKGARIDPQTVSRKGLSRCTFSGVEFIGPFDGAIIEETNFTGSKGAKVDLQTVYYDDLSICNLTDAEVMNTEIQNLIEVLEKTKDGEYITLPNPDILFVKDIIKFGKSDRVPYRKFAIPEKLLKKINFSNVSFANVDIRGLNFIRYKGVKINPQTVFGKDLSGCIFLGVEFIGPFDGVKLVQHDFKRSKGTDFTGSKGAKINPQTVYKKDLSGCKFSGVEFIGPFDNVILYTLYNLYYKANAKEAKSFLIKSPIGIGTNFTGSKGAKINPQTIYNKNLSECKFSGVEFIGSFDRVIIKGADFTGSKGALVDRQTVYYDDLAILTDVEIIDYGPKLSPAPGFALMKLTRNKKDF